MLVCFLLTDKQAKKYAKRKLGAMLESWLTKKENLNAKELFLKRKTGRQVDIQFNDIYVIELE